MRKREEIGAQFSHRDELDGKQSFFLVGIGGAGMSALARMLMHRGYRVRGTDSTASVETDRLIAEGFEVYLGHSGDAIESGDALILTDAIDLQNSPEFDRARVLGIPIVRRSQALGWLLKGKKVIAVTGTHARRGERFGAPPGARDDEGRNRCHGARDCSHGGLFLR